MRTKALLCAAAVVAAGAVTSMAQNVYSLNVVGYVNVTVPAGFNVYVNPLSNGQTNGANEIFSALPNGTTILTWNGSSYVASYYDASLGISPNNWYQADGVTPSVPPSLPPGLGFFMNPGSAFTATFVGSVVPAPGTTNNMAVPAGFQLVGSVLPVSGAVTNSSFNLPLNNGMTVLTWNGSAYTAFYYDASLGISPNNWYLSDGVTPGPVPSINVGQGFFWNPAGNTTWIQTLSAQ